MTVAKLEPCLICQPAARAAVDPGIRALLEGLIAKTPPDCLPGYPCWNCLGRQVVRSFEGRASEVLQGVAPSPLPEACTPDGSPSPAPPT